MNPLQLTDFYKVHHGPMYPPGTTKIYSNLTARKSRLKGVDKVVFFGLQHFILEYLIKRFNDNFFFTTPGADNARRILNRQDLKREMIKEYKKHIPVETKHIEALWDLGYLPIEVKALEEGTLCPIGVPMLTITNTHPDFFWLTNYLETLMSCMLWQPTTSATIAYEYRKLLRKYSIETTGDDSFVTWQGHDFSMRGMSSVESAILSGMGHLLSFSGTDTIPAIYQLEESYAGEGLIGASVPATEHSVMCAGGNYSEQETFDRLLKLYPTGILSVVSDTWDLWHVLTVILPNLKDQIIKRDGKLVIRPDSGDPVDIICGLDKKEGYSVFERDGKIRLRDEETFVSKEISSAEVKGVVELLWDVFGGKVNKYGYKELDPHIGAIYGDSITLDRADSICQRLKQKGFASTNVVFGIGSYTYQYNTRDTFGFAIKATYAEVEGKGREIFKDPVTDDGTKKSKKGLLKVFALQEKDKPETYQIFCKDQCTAEEEKEGLLTTVFKDGKLVRRTTLAEIREKLTKQL